MDFLQQAAGKYMGSEDRPSAGGNGGGLDWSHLSRLTEQYSFLDNNKDGKVDASDFAGFFGGSGGGHGGGMGGRQQAAQSAMGGGGPPPGYPSFNGKTGNSDIVHQLLNKFQGETGEKFQGTGSQYAQLSSLASKLTGQNIPLPVLEKLVKWKLGGGI